MLRNNTADMFSLSADGEGQKELHWAFVAREKAERMGQEVCDRWVRGGGEITTLMPAANSDEQVEESVRWRFALERRYVNERVEMQRPEVVRQV